MARTYNFAMAALRSAVLPLFWFGVLAGLVIYGSDAPSPLPSMFEARGQLVLVPVTVTDHNGQTIEGLSAGNFKVFDDRVQQRIISFSSEDAPCSAGLVLDISGSMRDALATAKKVAHAFFRTANGDDEFSILTVSTRPATESGFTSDTGALEQTIQSARPGGMTALIDTVYLGLNSMKRAKRPRRALLIISDGMDNYSRYSKSELLHAALEADVQVYSILLDGLAGGPPQVLFRPSMIAKPGDRAAQRQGPQMLRDLSVNTGGLYFHVKNATQAEAAANKAGRALRNMYVIGYAPRESGLAGKWHRISVKSNVRNVNVYGRYGYYAR